MADISQDFVAAIHREADRLMRERGGLFLRVGSGIEKWVSKAELQELYDASRVALDEEWAYRQNDPESIPSLLFQRNCLRKEVERLKAEEADRG